MFGTRARAETVTTLDAVGRRVGRHPFLEATAAANGAEALGTRLDTVPCHSRHPGPARPGRQKAAMRRAGLDRYGLMEPWSVTNRHRRSRERLVLATAPKAGDL